MFNFLRKCACGSDDIRIEENVRAFSVKCQNCHLHTIGLRTREQVIESWNEGCCFVWKDFFIENAIRK